VGKSNIIHTAGIQVQTYPKAKVTYIDHFEIQATRAASLCAELNNPGGKTSPWDVFVSAKSENEYERLKNGELPILVRLYFGRGQAFCLYMSKSLISNIRLRKCVKLPLGSKIGDMYAVEAGFRYRRRDSDQWQFFAIDAASQLAGGYSMIESTRN